jgi:hypothetical protein
MAVYNSTHTGQDIDNAINAIEQLTENIEIAIAAAGYQIIGDFADGTKAEVTLENQVYTSKSVTGFESYVWRTTETLPYTPTGSDPTVAPELGKWVAVAIGELQTISRVLNSQDNQIIYSSDTVTSLDGIVYIYDATAQLIWKKPSSVGAGETIVTVSGDNLTTSAASYTLGTVVTDSVFETVADLQASSINDGAKITVKERAFAQYIIQPSGFTALGGDITLSTGKVAELQLKDVNDVRWWGVVGDGSDEFTNLDLAYRRCAASNVWLSGYGLTVGVGQRMYLITNTKIKNMTIQAVGMGWDGNTADVDTNTIGKPIMSAKEHQHIQLKDLIIDCGLTTIDATNQDVAAAGIVWLENSENTSTSNVFIKHFNGYGVWTRDKHGQSFHSGYVIAQWLWGEKGWFDVTARTAYGWVNSSGDFMADEVIPYYNKSNIHIIDGAFTTNWGRVHPFNGSDEVAALDNITQTGGSGQIFDSVYLDNGYITLTDAFDIEFNVIKHVRTTNASNAFLLRLITSQADATARNLYINRANLVTNDLVLYSTTGAGTWSSNKEHVFKSITRKGSQTSALSSHPHVEHKVTQTHSGRKVYEISSDGGSSVVNSEQGIFAARETRFGPAFSAAKLGGSNKILLAGNPDADITVQPTSGQTLAILQFSGSNGTDFGTGANPNVGKGAVKAVSSENWTPTAMGTELQFGIVSNGGTSEITPLVVSTSGIHPAGDNVRSCGKAGSRWSEVFSANGTINTSDERLKTQQAVISDVILDAWAAVEKKAYKWVDAVDTKSDNARWHFGVMAQDIINAFDSYGLDATRYGVLCYDEWPEKVISHPEEYNTEYDKEGNVVSRTLVKDAWEEIIPPGNMYGVRYDQAAQLDAALERRERKKLEARLDAL